MQGLKKKECKILKKFRRLDSDRQRALLARFIAETNPAPTTTTFQQPHHARFYKFVREQWPMMSLEFFHETMRRGDILREKSYGNGTTSSSNTGDLFLQAESFGDKLYGPPYREYQFYDRMEFFYGDVLRECRWKHMWICKLEQDAVYSTKYRIKDLMELSVEEFEQKMKEFKFL